MAQKLVIDLSGRKGLSNKYYGDVGLFGNGGTVRTNWNYTAEDGEMVSGTFNPLSKYGYLSPSVNTFIDITPEVSFTVGIAATQVDISNTDVYFFEAGTKLHKATDFDDLIMADDRTISGATGTDLAIYTINGYKHLFYAYRHSSESRIGIKDISATAAPTFTADATTDIITISGGSWTLWENRAIYLTTTTTLPAGLATGTIYYLKGVSGATAQLSLTAGGAAIDITDTGTGTHSISLFNDILLGTGGVISGNFAPALSTMKMIPSGDGFTYLLAQNNVYRIDGTAIGGANGTISAALLTAPSTFYLSHGLDYRSNLYFVVHKNTAHQSVNEVASETTHEVGVYIWNRQSTFFNTSDYIPIFGIQQIRSIFVAPNGKIRIICIAANRTTQIREFDGSSFKVIKELAANAYPIYEDSVVVNNGFVTWLAYDCNVYYYGSEHPGEKEFLFIAAVISTATSRRGWSIAYAGGDSLAGSSSSGNRADREALYISWLDTGTYDMAKVFPFGINTVNGTNIQQNLGNVYTAVKYLPRMATVKHIDVFMAAYPELTPSTVTEGKIDFYFNGSQTSWAQKTITRNDIIKGYASFEINKPYINSIQMKISWFNNGSQNSGATYSNVGVADFSPSYAIVEYEPTGTIK